MKVLRKWTGSRKFWRVDKNAIIHIKHFYIGVTLVDILFPLDKRLHKSQYKQNIIIIMIQMKITTNSIKLSNTLIKRLRLYWLRAIFARSKLSDKKCYLIIIMITYNVWLILLRLRYNDVIATSRVGFLILPC